MTALRRTSLTLWVALSLAATPVAAERYRNPGPPFSIDYPDGWKILPGQGGPATRATGPGGSMNTSIAAASRPDFDADDFSGAELDQIADPRLVYSVTAVVQMRAQRRLQPVALRSVGSFRFLDWGSPD